MNGPLSSGDGFLKLQPSERRPFQEVFNGLTQHRKCYIVHGVWHSGKTTLLNSLDERLRLVGIRPIRLEVSIACTKMRMEGELALYRYFAWETFQERLDADEFRSRLLKAHGFESTSKVCFLIDELQGIQWSSVCADMLNWLAVNNFPFIGVGTFQLKSLEWSVEIDGSISPFNKVIFRKMPPFTGAEMHKIFDKFEASFDEYVPQAVREEMIRESGGHAASFNVLLRMQLFHKTQSARRFARVLEERYKTEMNGMKYRVQEALEENADLRSLVRSLSGKFTSTWTMNLRHLSPTWKQAFNVGILSVVGYDSDYDLDEVRFTSNIIYRVCIDNAFPRYTRLRTVESPVALLKESIQCISARQVNGARGAWDQAGPAENIFHSEVYATLRNIMARRWTCTNEVRHDQDSSSTKLDLLIRDDQGEKYAGYEFRVDLTTWKDFENGFEQADGYLCMLGIDVFLVNITSKNRNPQLPPSRSGKQRPNLNVHFINVLYDDEFKVFQFRQHGVQVEVIQAIGE